VAPADVVRLLKEATGFDYTEESVLRAGERGWNLKRAVNCRLGFSPHSERLPGHFQLPLQDGPSAGFVAPLDEMLTEYYAQRGWDRSTGRPLADRLEELDLADIVKDLWGEPER
jgi:aldehyde:ferredoxin oxidoreductase